jgi:KUP system potassium uptake protein
MDDTHAVRGSRAALALGALGVVFGDIGTSPLYAIQTVFSADVARPVGVDQDAVYGVISLVFWAIVIVEVRGVRDARGQRW